MSYDKAELPTFEQRLECFEAADDKRRKAQLAREGAFEALESAKRAYEALLRAESDAIDEKLSAHRDLCECKAAK